MTKKDKPGSSHSVNFFHEKELTSIFMQAPALMCVFEGPTHVFRFVNPPYQSLVGNRLILGKPIAEAMPELIGQPIFGLLDKVYTSGESYHAHEMMVQLDHQNTGTSLGNNYYNFVYQALRNEQNEIWGILVFAYEVTSQVTAKQKEQELNEQLAAVNEELQSSLEQLTSANEQLVASNLALEKAQEELRQLNSDLEKRVHRRTQQLEEARSEAEFHRQHLTDVFTQAPIGIGIYNGPDHMIGLVNPFMAEILGKPADQLLGKPLFHALPEVVGQGFEEILKGVYTNGIPFEAPSIPATLYRNGKYVEGLYHTVYQPLRDAAGEITGIIQTVIEVTELVEAKQHAEQSANQLRMITDALPVLIGYLDKDEIYRFTNKAYEAWFPFKAEDLIGQKVKDVLGENAYHNIKTYIDRALAGEKLDFEAFMPYRENFIRYIKTSYVPDVKEGEVNGFYTLVTDITDQVITRQEVEESSRQNKALAEELALANKNLQFSNKQLQHTNKDLDTFIYTASHDLKNPILNIEGLVDALEDELALQEIDPASIHRIVGYIKASVLRFKRTIEVLSDVAKLQNELGSSSNSVDVAKVVLDTQLDLETAIQSTGAQITVSLESCPTLNISEKNFRSIIYNLLSNAIKYSSPERTPEIFIECRVDDNYQVLSVRDNGLGMDLSKTNKLFEIFSRLHDHVDGTGVGLYMVKRIVENAGGKIEVQSKVNRGSTFTVFLPL